MWSICRRISYSRRCHYFCDYYIQSCFSWGVVRSMRGLRHPLSWLVLIFVRGMCSLWPLVRRCSFQLVIINYCRINRDSLFHSYRWSKQSQHSSHFHYLWMLRLQHFYSYRFRCLALHPLRHHRSRLQLYHYPSVNNIQRPFEFVSM